VRIVFGGNRSGKSTAGTNEARWLAEGSHPFRPFRAPTKGCIVCQDFQTHAKDIIVPKIEEWFPPSLWKKAPEKNQAQTPVKYFLKNGSTIDIKSHDQDIKVFEGSDYDWVWFDEPPPRAIFQALWRGLTDRRGICFITGTPITEPWLADLYAKAKAEDNKGMYWAEFMDIEQNARNIGEGDEKEGHRRIKEFLDAIDDPDERETRKTGKLLHMRGLVFKGWSRPLHLIKPFKWPARWPILASLDPHPRKDWALSFLGLTPSDNKILLSSYYVPGVVSEVAAHILWAREQIELDGPGVPLIMSCWIDNYASVESMIQQTTILDELNRLVTPTIPKFQTAPKNVDEKISILKDWLHPKESKYGTRPEFLAFDNEENKNFIYEIEHYVWARLRGANRNSFRNVPVKENDDILDTIMQLALVLDSKRGHVEAKSRAPIIKYAGGTLNLGNNRQ
jgi:phage terminase large subunit-like protein